MPIRETGSPRGQAHVFATLLEGAPDPIWAKDLTGHYIFANRACREIMGVGPDDPIPSDEERFPPEVARSLRLHDRRVAESGAPMEFEERVPVEGGWRTFLTSKFPLREEDGTLVGICGISRDATPRIRAEAALRESEARFHVGLDVTRAMVYSSDLDNGRILALEGAEGLLGVDTNVSRDREWWMGRIHPEDVETARAVVEAATAAGDDVRLEYRIRHEDGRWVWVEDDLRTLLDAEGRPWRHIGVVRDITDRHRAREERLRLIDELEEASRAKSDFMGTVSHELRTPLNAVLGYLQILEEGIAGELPAEARGYLERIRVTARHQQRVIEEILTFNRLEAGRERVLWEEVELEEVVREVEAVIRPLAREGGLDFTLAGVGGTLVTDGRKLRQVLLNLLGNAVKYTEQGGVRLDVRIRGPWLEVRVSDSGPGIEVDDLSEVFEPFWQSRRSRDRAIEGTGLGLAITRRFVELLDGSVSVESEAGRGTTFTVRIPTRPERADGPAGPIA